MHRFTGRRARLSLVLASAVALACTPHAFADRTSLPCEEVLDRSLDWYSQMVKAHRQIGLAGYKELSQTGKPCPPEQREACRALRDGYAGVEITPEAALTQLLSGGMGDPKCSAILPTLREGLAGIYNELPTATPAAEVHPLDEKRCLGDYGVIHGCEMNFYLSLRSDAPSTPAAAFDDCVKNSNLREYCPAYVDSFRQDLEEMAALPRSQLKALPDNYFTCGGTYCPRVRNVLKLSAPLPIYTENGAIYRADVAHSPNDALPGPLQMASAAFLRARSLCDARAEMESYLQKQTPWPNDELRQLAESSQTRFEGYVIFDVRTAEPLCHVGRHVTDRPIGPGCQRCGGGGIGDGERPVGGRLSR